MGLFWEEEGGLLGSRFHIRVLLLFRGKGGKGRAGIAIMVLVGFHVAFSPFFSSLSLFLFLFLFLYNFFFLFLLMSIKHDRRKKLK